jgi:hypothetical protein
MTGSVRSRLWTATTVSGRELLRDRVFVALVLVLPVYFVGSWGALVPDDPVTITVPGGDGSVTVATEFVPLLIVLIALATGALLVGIAALFLVRRSRAIDQRLYVVGYRPAEVLVAHFALLTVINAVVVAMTTAIALVHLNPEHLWWFVLALVLAAATYGAVGVITGLVLGRMAGVYLLLFAPMLDIMLLQLPLGDSPWWADWLPGRHAADLALSAAFAETVAVGHAVWAVVVVFGLSAFGLILTGVRS